MSEDVRRLLSGLEAARDVNLRCQMIDHWVSRGKYDLLGELAAVLVRMSSANPQSWQPGSLLEHLRRSLAFMWGRRNVAFLIEQLIPEGTPARQLRETAARLASAQEPEALVAALEQYESEVGLAEFLYVLTQEAVLRRKIGEMTPVAKRLADRMRREGHPLACLPLGLTDLEVDIQSFLPHYGPHGSSSASAGTSGDSDPDRTAVGTGATRRFRETTTPEMAERVAKAVRDWIEESNGRYEARFFDFEEPFPTDEIVPSALRSLGLECLAGAGETAIQIAKITASQGFGHLFSAATSGGAYCSGSGAAYGRLSAWESVAALGGCSEGEISTIAALAGHCSWFTFQSRCDWFYDVAWDIGLAVLRPGRKSLSVFAATDTD
jgi:Family of unknown function (DUF6183)